MRVEGLWCRRGIEASQVVVSNPYSHDRQWQIAGNSVREGKE